MKAKFERSWGSIKKHRLTLILKDSKTCRSLLSNWVATALFSFRTFGDKHTQPIAMFTSELDSRITCHEGYHLAEQCWRGFWRRGVWWCIPKWYAVQLTGVLPLFRLFFFSRCVFAYLPFSVPFFAAFVFSTTYFSRATGVLFNRLLTSLFGGILHSFDMYKCL